MKYPIAFCDYDGTIFDGAAMVVPDRTRSAIFDYIRAGGVFVLTTGRMYRSIMMQLDRMGLKPDYLICMQGSVGYDFTTGAEVFRHGLPCADWHRVAAFAEARGWVFQAYHGLDVYTAQANPYSDEYFAYTGVQGVITGEPLSTYPEARDWDVHKMIVMSPSAETPTRVAMLREAFPHLDVTCSTDRYIEIVSAASGKGNGLRAMCRHLGFSPAEAMAFGDETNDCSLLEAAGLGVAVANANPALRAVADLMTAPCAEGGVADVLHSVIRGTDPVPYVIH